HFVTVRAQNLKGEPFEIRGEDLLARAFCHEIDHLNGILFLQHLSMLKRDLIKRKIKKLKNQGEWYCQSVCAKTPVGFWVAGTCGNAGRFARFAGRRTDRQHLV